MFPAKLGDGRPRWYDATRFYVSKPLCNGFKGFLPLFVGLVLVFPAGNNLINRWNVLSGELLVDEALESVEVVCSFGGHDPAPFTPIKRIIG
jgi:hypothetical protein